MTTGCRHHGSKAIKHTVAPTIWRATSTKPPAAQLIEADEGNLDQLRSLMSMHATSPS
jgi:hypothetical protein